MNRKENLKQITESCISKAAFFFWKSRDDEAYRVCLQNSKSFTMEVD
jgi:hypothetical protein